MNNNMVVSPVLFLDFDGVLLTEESYLRNPNDPQAEPKCVDVLNWILEQTRAEIVVSSAWRHFFALPDLRRLLAQWGVKGHAFDTTPDLNTTRGDEIKTWARLNLAPDAPLVAIDDDHRGLKGWPYFVQTTMTHGLTMREGRKARAILRARKEILTA